MRTICLIVPFLVPLVSSVALAQAAGLRGANQELPPIHRLEAPSEAATKEFVVVEAVAQVRVAPTQLRLVFAVSATGETTSAASVAGSKVVAATSARLQAAGVAASDIDIDFIAAVPVYAWGLEQQEGSKVLAERRRGTRVQNNLHVVVPDEARAREVIEAAANGEGVDLLAVDYWSEDLERRQAEALEKAMQRVQSKAKTMLAVFAEPPRPINVWEQTKVLFPQQLYQNLPRAEDSGAGSFWSRDIPQLQASRPLQVYYRGLFGDLDVRESRMPGAREIEIVSTVRIYYEAPCRAR